METTKINPLQPKTVALYQDLSGNTHPTRLQCLVANKAISLRGIVQSDTVHGKNSNYTAHQVAQIMDKNSAAITDTVRKFDAAIKREMAKGGAAK